jgi:hypothetical protein
MPHDSESSAPPLALPLFRRDHPGDDWRFVATAFAVASDRLLTVRHAVDGGQVLKQSDGALVFQSADDSGEWAVALPGNDGAVAEVRVRPGARPPDARLDAVLLELLDSTQVLPPAVLWLDGLDFGQLQRTGLGAVSGVVVGYPGFQPGFPAGWPESGLEPDERLVSQLATPGTRKGAGLVTFRIPEGGLDAGMSGSPVFLDSAYGRFCVGMARLGGERSASATVLGAGSIVAWLKDEVTVPRMEARDLPPEAAAAGLAKVRQKVRSLLVPLLGGGTGGPREAGQRGISLTTEADFIRLFVCLHARRDVAGGPVAQPRIRPDAVRDLYEAARSAWKDTMDLPPFEVAEQGSEGFGRSLVQFTRAAVEKCAGPVRNPEPSAEGEVSEENPIQKELCRYLDLELAAGNQRLNLRDPFWEALRSGRGVVLAGGAGSGKSTVAQFLALALAVPEHRGSESKLSELFETVPGLRGRIPVFLRFRDLNPSLASFDPGAASEAWERGIEQIVSTAWEKLEGGVMRSQLLLIWDGLDELAESARPGFARALVHWTGGLGKGSLSVVTSRPTAYPPADPHQEQPAGQGGSELAPEGWWQFEGFDLWHLEPLDPVQQRELLEGFLAAQGVEDSAERAKTVFEDLRKGRHEDLAKDPLMLAALVRLSEERRRKNEPLTLPSRRAEVYSEIVDLMLYRWEGDRAGAAASGLSWQLQQSGLSESGLREIGPGVLGSERARRFQPVIPRTGTAPGWAFPGFQPGGTGRVGCALGLDPSVGDRSVGPPGVAL